MEIQKNKIKALFITLLVFGSPFIFVFKDSVTHGVKTLYGSIVERGAERASIDTEGKTPAMAKVIDQFNGIPVFDNGRVANVHGRNWTDDGYNLGLKYQCVEFVKRYYYERFNHKMPDSYGHARDFFDPSISDGQMNNKRGLIQHSNPGNSRPTEESILVYGPNKYNPFGHVSIITSVSRGKITCISQNLGKGNGTRRSYKLVNRMDDTWYIDEPDIIGWLSP